MSVSLENQLLATKFYMPVVSGPLISRTRLNTLLSESLKFPLTLVTAPAGFGKTMALSIWAQSLPSRHLLVAWLSLDEEDNDPQLFWTYVVAALNAQQPGYFITPLKLLRSPQAPHLKDILTMLINLLQKSAQDWVLILDDYHLITEQEVHTSLSYLLEHISPQLHIIISTRSNPPLQRSKLRARRQVLEVRTQQLRCTAEETGAFFEVVMGTQFPDETIQQVTARTEGWLVGLQLLRFSLSGHADPASLLEEVRGDQRYILDFLTEEVLRQQPQEVQNFLLSTCILERLTASLCDAVREQSDSQQLLDRLEQANLFLVSLDSKGQWYRYHALFAQALHCQLKQAHANLIPILHGRASRWYDQHQQATQAILHGLCAKEWDWVADLIEQKHLPLLSFAWGTGRHAQVLLRQWLEKLPANIIASRPRLCLTCSAMLWAVTPQPLLSAWLDVAEIPLVASLKKQTHGDTSQPLLSSEARQEQLD
ncbi:MAG: hypothetical protein JOZ18_00045, partial [Chloroflexi bacterium]|nr:hypothetical protein [Chloroflexota bacterium]